MEALPEHIVPRESAQQCLGQVFLARHNCTFASARRDEPRSEFLRVRRHSNGRNPTPPLDYERQSRIQTAVGLDAYLIPAASATNRIEPPWFAEE
jgi:hypothetical protein